jgi:hypothetical protein
MQGLANHVLDLVDTRGGLVDGPKPASQRRLYGRSILQQPSFSPLALPLECSFPTTQAVATASVQVLNRFFLELFLLLLQPP